VSYDRYFPSEVYVSGIVLDQPRWQLRENFDSRVANGSQEINIAEWMGKVSIELIGQAGLGYSFGTLEGRNDRFYQALKEFSCV
jgi:hypothetical protein